MNQIEVNGINSKRMKVTGQMFEDAYDLAMTVIKSIEARSKTMGYALERFEFNFSYSNPK
ncbi:hypothetical protein ACKFKF_21305 [Phormidesmis sp. 146-12]